MTRKDYISIARALRSTYSSACGTRQSAETLEGILRAAYSVASELADDNPRFNGWHFMDVVRGTKALESRPPRGDSRRMEHGRPQFVTKTVCYKHIDCKKDGCADCEQEWKEQTGVQS
jgi:hypothetical protein